MRKHAVYTSGENALLVRENSGKRNGQIAGGIAYHPVFHFTRAAGGVDKRTPGFGVDHPHALRAEFQKVGDLALDVDRSVIGR